MEFEKLKIEFIKIPLLRFTNKTRISEKPFNTTKDLRKPMKSSNENILPSITTFNSKTIISIALLNPLLTVQKVTSLELS